MRRTTRTVAVAAEPLPRRGAYLFAPTSGLARLPFRSTWHAPNRGKSQRGHKKQSSAFSEIQVAHKNRARKTFIGETHRDTFCKARLLASPENPWSAAPRPEQTHPQVAAKSPFSWKKNESPLSATEHRDCKLEVYLTVQLTETVGNTSS